MSALKLSNKFDQVVYTGNEPIISDVRCVYSHSEGFLTGIINISNKKVAVVNVRGFWNITK